MEISIIQDEFFYPHLPVIKGQLNESKIEHKPRKDERKFTLRQFQKKEINN